MLEVHAILQRQMFNENITKKSCNLSDAYIKKAFWILKVSFYSENGDFFFSLKSSISVILIIQSIFDYYKPIFSSLIEK